MALSGVHAACVRAGISGFSGSNTSLAYYIGQPGWSENVTSAGPGTKTVPANTPHQASARWLLVFNAAAASYVQVGSNPGVASATNGYYIPAGGKLEVAVNPGDTWSWAAA